MSDCFHAAGFYWKNFQLHPAAYNSPRIKLLQIRATLSDEDNVIAKRGTQGGIGLFNPPSINAICLVIPAISRIGKRVKSSAYSKATALWVYLQTTKVNCITTYQEYDIYHPVSWMMPSMSIGIYGIFHSLDRIESIYPCNIIHEIGHSYCSDVWQELGVYATSLNLIWLRAGTKVP